MSLNNATLKTGATMAPTGGSDLNFESRGNLLDRNNLFVPADLDLRTRREISCVIKDPKVSASAPNGYTQARATATFKSPLELDNGNITVNTVQISMACDVETTDAEKDELLIIAAQMLTDADFTSFFKALSVQ